MSISSSLQNAGLSRYMLLSQNFWIIIKLSRLFVEQEISSLIKWPFFHRYNTRAVCITLHTLNKLDCPFCWTHTLKRPKKKEREIEKEKERNRE